MAKLLEPNLIVHSVADQYSKDEILYWTDYYAILKALFEQMRIENE